MLTLAAALLPSKTTQCKKNDNCSGQFAPTPKNVPINWASSIPRKTKWLLVEKVNPHEKKTQMSPVRKKRWRSLITQQHFVFRQILGRWHNDLKGAALYCSIRLDPGHVHLRATPANLIEQTNTRAGFVCSPKRHSGTRMSIILTLLISGNTTSQITVTSQQRQEIWLGMKIRLERN